MAAAFITDYKVMVIVVVAASRAVLGKTSEARSCSRMLLGGWMAMAITYAFTKLIGYSGVKI
ncbi:unnamed protein product [Prunus armeniaca]|uniref:Uncharacterized protein n=1 Tax=Prunus armeniaca TaxID=36596 RepID=A0A6J5W919_PRUAR|nr:unnamed protein product [Prunus armeniaca]